ncbi:MAG: transposase [Gammaproteobacteria bacterium]
MQYRRARIKGGTYFFTVNLADRRATYLTDYIEMLHASIEMVRNRHPFNIDAMVVLPDHLHAIWTLAPNDDDYPRRWMLIKAAFFRGIPIGERRRTSRLLKGERGIWQRRYWEHLIRGEQDYTRHVDYIHYNPVKHGYVLRPADWPHSSIHRYTADGHLSADWGAGVNFSDSGFGEV